MRLTAEQRHAMCSGKRRFADGGTARAAMHTIRTRGQRLDSKPQRAYPCPACNGWHLTSRDE